MDKSDKAEEIKGVKLESTPTMTDKNQNDFLSQPLIDQDSSMKKNAYQVLARKYRPQTFDDLMGQEIMVQTLKNAFKTNRIAHAYMLTGVRGVGKTTTARLLARSLNYETDIINEPNIDMLELGKHCLEIMESRHIDVIEMDAASRTGIADIREIIDSVNYSPASARYKIYIIDEVHMLSKAAFNGLLKTLEEPPAHVKFIFATTEVQKIPLTILSRCQRFDLKRFDNDMIKLLIDKVCEEEKVIIEDSIINLIARVSGGSARDSLSLLDQAIALADDGNISEEKIRQILGLSDQARIIDLYEYIINAEIEKALEEVREQVSIGVDPTNLIESLGDLIHELTNLRVTENNDDNLSLGPEGFQRIKKLTEKTSVRNLSRYWQMIIKASAEIKNFSKPLAALEMAIIRMSYISKLPTPDEIIKKIEEDNSFLSEKKTPNFENDNSLKIDTDASFKKPQEKKIIEEISNNNPKNFEEIIELVRLKKNISLQYDLENNVSLVSFEEGKIELNILNGDENILLKLSKNLLEWTNKKWIILNSSLKGQKTIKEIKNHNALEVRAKIKEHPIYKKASAEFNDISITSIEEVEKLSIVNNENNKKISNNE
ncbi:MAG: DNA polymerase III subunit gamma/tau [Rhizobiales bacterium TMED168]|nr:MAG: DNA polymerase III subunit gamma/tau [Rhizobiales bacterium TMED168]